ncbi:MAG: pilus assembly protein PilW [Proteobacteria bacterium]|nr:pilus assembly protein PilW [Pseudomonadota bacterium]
MTIHHLPRQRGFTLVELMIAMALGLFLVGAALNVVFANRQAFQIAENQSRLQENARAAFELLAHDIRAAGGNPCGANRVTNNLTNSAALWWANWAAGPIRGFENSAAGDGAHGIVPVGAAMNNRLAGSDAIIVMSANAGETVVAAQHNSGAAPPSFRVTNNQHGFTQGSVILACDEMDAVIFEATNIQPVPANTTIEHAAGGIAPGNIQANLGKTYANGTFLSRLRASFWYVGSNGRGSNSLFRLGVDGQPAPRLDEVVEGVTNMQIQYIERNPATGLLTAGTWINANQIASWPFVLTSPRVEAVRIQLSLSSRDQVGIDPATGNPKTIDTELNETIYLRNREYNP